MHVHEHQAWVCKHKICMTSIADAWCSHAFIYAWIVLKICSGNKVFLVIVKNQRNSTQLNSKAASVGVRHSSHVYPTHICCGTSPYMLWNLHTNSTSTIKNDPRGLKFCMRPHLTKLTTTQHNFNPTNYWGGQKNFWVKKIFVQKILGNRNLWLGRGGWNSMVKIVLGCC